MKNQPSQTTEVLTGARWCNLSNREHRYQIGRVYELLLQVAQNALNDEDSVPVSEKNSISGKDRNSASVV